MERQIVYSRRIMLELIKRGFKPIDKLPNPEYDNYLCWIFEDTEEFHRIFEELTKKDR